MDSSTIFFSMLLAAGEWRCDELGRDGRLVNDTLPIRRVPRSMRPVDKEIGFFDVFNSNQDIIATQVAAISNLLLILHRTVFDKTICTSVPAVASLPIYRPRVEHRSGLDLEERV